MFALGRFMAQLRSTLMLQRIITAGGCKKPQIIIQKYQKPLFCKCHFRILTGVTSNPSWRRFRLNNKRFFVSNDRWFHQCNYFFTSCKTYSFFSANTNLILKNLENKMTFKRVYTKFSQFRRDYQYAVRRLEGLNCNRCVKVYPYRIFCDSNVCFSSNYF